MSLPQSLTLAGLLLDLVGAVLLFFFTVPKKKIGNVVLEGESMFELDDPNLRNVPESEWAPIFNKVIDRSRRLTKLGFALLVLGALLQIAGTVA